VGFTKASPQRTRFQRRGFDGSLEPCFRRVNDGSLAGSIGSPLTSPRERTKGGPNVTRSLDPLDPDRSLAGLLADRVVKGVALSLGGAILVGIIGAFVGGWLLAQLGLFPGYGLIGTTLTAFLGAVILLLVVRAVRT
jgi:uncharacterized membrane protein YeaQ/YmgE (transglycosylase-associated protein family)